MDGLAPSISLDELYAQLGTVSSPLRLAVRRAGAFGADERLIVGANHCSALSIARWQSDRPADREVVACSVRRHEVSRSRRRTAFMGFHPRRDEPLLGRTRCNFPYLRMFVATIAIAACAVACAASIAFAQTGAVM